MNSKSLSNLARLSSVPAPSNVGDTIPSSGTAQKTHRCPIKGCNMTYAMGTVGWAKHVGSVENHPYWHPDVEPADVRRDLFRAEFPAFFDHVRARPSGVSSMPPSSGSPLRTEAPLTREDLKALFREVLREAIDKL